MEFLAEAFWGAITAVVAYAYIRVKISRRESSERKSMAEHVRQFNRIIAARATPPQSTKKEG